LQVSDGSNWTDIGAAAPSSFTGNLAGDVTGTQSATVVSLVGGQSASSVASATTAANGATDSNTANALVKRDPSGNFTAGTITANLNGNATGITGNINGSQVTGNIAGNAASITGSIAEAQVVNLTNDLNAKANDNAVVHLTGAETIAGAKTFSSPVIGDLTGTADLAKSVRHYTNGTLPAAGAGNNGQIIFNSDTNTLQVSDGLNWTDIGAAAPASFTGSLAGDVTGTQSATVVSLVGGQSASSVANATTAANGATDANTVNALVKRDASGNFSAGTITASLNGNATSITGNINGSQVTGNIAGNAASITGSITGAQVSSQVADALHATNADNATNAGNANTVTNGVYTTGSYADPSWITSLAGTKITGSVALADIAKSVSHYTTSGRPAAAPANNGQIIFNSDTNTLQVSDGSNWTDIGAAAPASFTGSLAGDVTGTQSATVVSSVGGQAASAVASATTAANGATDANTVNALVKRDGSGNFSAGTITATLNGNATSITGNINGSQVTGNIAGNAASITGSITGAQVSSQVADALHATNADNATNAGNASTVTNGVYTTGSYADPSFITSLAGSKITGSVALADIAKSVTHYTTGTRPTADGSNNGQIIFNSTTNTLQVSDGSNWTDIGAAAPASFTGSLAGDVTGTQSATVVSSVGGATAANVASATSAANAATSSNSSGAIVKRDASGNFAAGTISANLTGNVTGDVTGNAGTVTNGVYTTGDQTIGGNKTFSNPIIGSITGNAATASSATTAGNVTGTVAVANGGTGLTSGTSGGIPGYTAAGTLASSALLTNNALVLGGGAGATPKTSANFTTSGSTLNVGTTGATGALQLNGSTSGVVTIQPQAAAGTFNFNLPTTPGTAGQVLTSQGGGAAAMTWTTAGTGTVTNGATLSSGQLIVGNGGTSVTVSNLSGDVTTSGSTATTLANSGVTAGTYPRVTVDVKGRVTAGLPANVTIVTGTAVAFGGGAVVGNTVTATATCSAGTMVGGGANITGNSASNHIATVTTSFPSAANTWTVVATEVVHGGNGSPPSVTAYALCIQ
jgi:hypothetical protein